MIAWQPLVHWRHFTLCAATESVDQMFNGAWAQRAFSWRRNREEKQQLLSPGACSDCWSAIQRQVVPTRLHASTAQIRAGGA